VRQFFGQENACSPKKKFRGERLAVGAAAARRLAAILTVRSQTNGYRPPTRDLGGAFAEREARGPARHLGIIWPDADAMLPPQWRYQHPPLRAAWLSNAFESRIPR